MLTIGRVAGHVLMDDRTMSHPRGLFGSCAISAPFAELELAVHIVAMTLM